MTTLVDWPGADKSGPDKSGAALVSVVIPVFNEADNVLVLLDEVRAVLSGRVAAEVIFVDDGSTDATAERLASRLSSREVVPVRLIRHLQRSGQSAAVRSGVKAASGGWIATLDGDGQNDPADILNLLEAARNDACGPALIGGVRARRRDTLSKRLASRFANALRQALLRDGAVDTGCGIKLFRRDAFLDLPFFGAQHRFLPALFRSHGHGVIFVEVNHRPRAGGVSKYVNWRRGVVGFFDLFGVLWLTCRTKVPPAVEEALAATVKSNYSEKK
ncbi:MAG: glycosyltransferase family 2 protein [Rhodospirillaceae bacterium]